MDPHTPGPARDEGLAVLSDAFKGGAGWGCAFSAFGLVAILAVPIFYLGGSLSERPLAVALAVGGFALLWAGKLRFRRYFAELRAPRRMPGFRLDRTSVRAGTAVVAFEGGAPPVEGTGIIASFQDAEMVREDWGSDLRLVLSLAPLGAKQRVQLTAISLARGDAELHTVSGGAGLDIWIARGREALVIDPEERDNAQLFQALRWISDALEAGACGPLAVHVALAAPRQGVDPHRAEGLPTDPETGEDIVGFTSRVGWDLAVT